MKYVLSLLSCAISIGLISQSQQFQITQDVGTFISDRLTESDDNLRIEEILWEESFANGIPGSWINENYDEDNSLTSAQWEFRGPSTSPDNSLGTVGNCIEEGTEGGVPIDSPTASDGFIIFDSDYWDSSEGNCGDFGTGLSPFPHNAQLTTSSFDFTDKPYVGMVFNQYLKNFNSTFKIQASVNGGEFQDVFVNDFSGTNDASPTDMQVRKDISNVAGGQSDVRIRFTFQGQYYFWMLDDMQLVQLEQNNLDIVQINHGSFSSTSASIVSSFSGLAYYQYPALMAATLSPSAQIENRGGETQSNCALEVLVTSEGATISETSSSMVNLAPGGIGSFTTTNVALASDIADYNMSFTAVQDEMDDSPENNVENRVIAITESTLARDEGVTDSFYTPSSDFNGQQYEVGTVYETSQEGLELYSISGAVSSSSQTGSFCYATLYGVSASNGIVLDPIATTNEQFIYPYQLNDLGEENMMVFSFSTPITLVADSSYLAVIGTYGGPEEVAFAFSGSSMPYTSWVKFEDNTVSYLDRTPMVRMNFGEVTSVEELETVNFSGKVYPNPASRQATLEYDLGRTSEVIVGIFDINGRHIENLFVGTQSSGTHELLIDVSSIPSGSYLIKLNSEFGKIEETLIVE